MNNMKPACVRWAPALQKEFMGQLEEEKWLNAAILESLRKVKI